MKDSTMEVLPVVQHSAAPRTEDQDMLEKESQRALRRHSERKIQKKRKKNHRWLSGETNERFLGRLRHNHFGCGCTMCKPWKHKAGRKLAEWERPEFKEPLEDFDLEA